MSKGDPQALKQLAEWRRAGFGIWHVTFVIEGYDDSETIILPGRMTKEQAIKNGKRECALQLDTKQKFIHMQTIQKKG